MYSIPNNFLVVADDLSGAADCAAAFCPGFGPVPVCFAWPQACGGSFVLDADTRAMGEAEAAARTRDVFAAIAAAAPRGTLVFKKVDSTLRGHVAAELDAALAALGRRAVVLAPAFTEQGRFVVGGHLRLAGQARGRGFADAYVPALLAAGGLSAACLEARAGETPDSLLGRIRAAAGGGARVIVCDTGNRGDLGRLAQALLAGGGADLLVAGSAGLARALAEAMGAARADGLEGAMPGTAPGRGVARGGLGIVVGSFSSTAQAQIGKLEQGGLTHSVRVPSARWAEAPPPGEFADARQRLAAGGAVLFAPSGGPLTSPPTRDMVQGMARAIAPLFHSAAAWLLTGGDTARAVLQATGLDRIEVTGELEPGLSIARPVGGKGPVLFIKAGGFGDSDVLQRVAESLAGSASAAPPAVAAHALEATP